VKKDPRVYLAHILECAQKIERYTHGGEKEFSKRYDASGCCDPQF